MLILKAGFAAAITFFRTSAISAKPVIFPTDTIYGIGAPVSSAAANWHIYEIKGRPTNKPFPVLIGNISQISPLVSDVNIDWLKDNWPEKTTIIFKANENVSELFKLNGNIAVRLISNSWLSEAISAIDTPVSATSVNLSGERPLLNFYEITSFFGDRISLILRGECGNKPSKIARYIGRKNVITLQDIRS
jgi:L-threonylcarbamoyladenylate synthase